MSEPIPGVPLGAKIVRIGKPNRGEWLLDLNCTPYQITEMEMAYCKNNVIVAPDNPYGKFLHEVEADIKAAGEEWSGELRRAKDGERWFNNTKRPIGRGATGEDVMILKPKTRRVLVVECDDPEVIAAVQAGKHWLLAVNHQPTGLYPYRIEERPA